MPSLMAETLTLLLSSRVTTGTSGNKTNIATLHNFTLVYFNIRGHSNAFQYDLKLTINRKRITEDGLN